MSFFAFSGLFNFIVSFFLGAFIGARTKNRETLIFSLCAFSVAFWSFGYYMWQEQQSSGTEELALSWCRFLMAGAIFIPITYFHYIVAFVNSIKRHKAYILTFYLIGLVFLYFDIFTNYFISGMEQQAMFRFWPMAGPLFLPFLITWFGSICYGGYLALGYYRKTDSKEKKEQIKFLILGTIISYAGGATNYFLWYGIPILPYGNILVFVYVAMIAFAILRYGLFDAKMILTEFLVGVMGFALIILPIVIPETKFKIATALMFAFFCFIGYMLIKTTSKEIEAKEHLEERVAERTQELQTAYEDIKKQKEELEKWYNLTIGRELKMAELKKKIGELEEKK